MKQGFIKGRIGTLEGMARAKGLSISAAAVLAGIDPATVSRWKTGEVEPGIFRFNTLFETIRDYKPTKGRKG